MKKYYAEFSKMFLWGVLFLTLMIGESGSINVTGTDCPNVRTDLGAVRKKRHLTFPDGSDVVLTISLVKAFMTHAPSGWNIALEIDVLFPLPDANFTNAHFRRKLHHRQKREFWERLKDALDYHNLNGRSCILRSICEAKTYLAPQGKSLVHDILRAIFATSQHEEELTEDGSYNEILEPNFCDKANDCPFSLLNFIMVLNKDH